MAMHRRRVMSMAVLVGTVALGSCAPSFDGSSPPRISDGISSELGGCDELPVFAGDSCDALAAEYGRLLDDEVIEIIEGPAGVDGEARSARLKQVMTLLAVVAGRRLDEVGIGRTCDVRAFRTIAEAEFSPQLREQVGRVMYDGDPVATYDEWLDDLENSLRVLGSE